MWIGLSRFEKSIPKINNMRGVRIRQSNIQLGNDDVVQHLFKESRGNYYFVGEVFAVDSSLIPNSQRNYFNENQTRVALEDALRDYFFDVLHKLYCDANKIKLAYRRQEEYVAKVNEFEEKSKNGFVDEEAIQKLQSEIEKAKEEADSAVKQLEKFSGEDDTSPITEVRKSISKKFNSTELQKKVESTETINPVNSYKKGNIYITSGLSKLSRNERKIVSNIMSIITKTAPKEIAEEIINKIKEDLK